ARRSPAARGYERNGGVSEKRKEEGRARGRTLTGVASSAVVRARVGKPSAGTAGGVSCMRDRDFPVLRTADPARWTGSHAGRPNLCARRGSAPRRSRERDQPLNEKP